MKKLIKQLFRNWSVFTVFLLGLIPLLWFYKKGDALISGVDINFPLAPILWFQRRFFVWNNITNAGIDFSSSTAGLFFHSVQVILYQLGLSLQGVQVVSLVFWFMLIVFSAWFLSRALFPKNQYVQVLFVVLYSFNIFLFNTWENIKVANLSLVAAIPLTLATLLLLRERKISYSRAGLLAVFAGIVLSGAGINPAYFISFFFLFLLYEIVSMILGLKNHTAFTNVKHFLFIASIIVLVNLFWILPTLSFIFKNIGPTGISIDKIGFTNWIDSLSQNTSILNIMRLQGAWDWYAFDGITNLPLYIPYALNYFYRPIFIVFSFALPSLTILAFLFRGKERKYLYTTFGLMFAVGVFLGVGTYLPTGTLYRWLINHLLFFTLFRSPWYIFTPLVTLSSAGLIGLLFYRLAAKVDKSGIKFGRVLTPLVIIVLAVGNLFYSYPLVTGKIFRPSRRDGFYINFPSYVFEAQEWLASQKDGRVLTYPDDEIEQFRWGYRGIESILQLIADKEVLFSPLNAPGFPAPQLVREMYRNLKLGQTDAVISLAGRLNVDLLFEKKDQGSLSPPLPSRIANLPKQSFGDWNFYKFPQDKFSTKIYAPENMLFGYPFSLRHRFQGALHPSSLLVDPEDSVVKNIPSIVDFTGAVVLAENLQEEDFIEFATSPSVLANRLVSRDVSQVVFNFKIPADGFYQPTLERYRVEDFGIDTAVGVIVEVDGNKETWTKSEESDSYIFFQPVRFTYGDHRILLQLDNKNLVRGGDFEGEEIYFNRVGKAIFEMVTNEQGRYLSLFNKGEGAPEPSADFKILSFDPQMPYVVEFKYRQIYGNNANAIVLQGTKDTLVKAQTERLPNYPEWNTFSFYYEPVKTESATRIALVAPYTPDPLGTKVLYDDLKVHKVFTNRLAFIKIGEQQFLASPKIDFTMVSPVEYTAKVSGASGPHVIVFSENYSPEWGVEFQDLDGTQLSIEPLHFSANSYANAWFVQKSPEQYKARIYYKPQRLFRLGLGLSFLTVIIVLGFSLRQKYGKKSH
ncbi:MAG: hypothetical protein Q7S60_00810 [bacterium]|nr:hypothetical protein [bacterium]